MPDRYANGVGSNDSGGLSGGRATTGYDPTDTGYFHGGDLKGLAEHLQRIKDLGFTALWLTPVLKQDIIQFRFGKDVAEGTSPNLSRAQQAAEYAAIIAKLEAVKIARRRERHQQRGPTGQEAKDGVTGDDIKTDPKQDVVIEWKHIEASLATTRSSVGADEKGKLERIYREFFVGRNGEMPNGQGPTEVGGRSSLM